MHNGTVRFLIGIETRFVGALSGGEWARIVVVKYLRLPDMAIQSCVRVSATTKLCLNYARHLSLAVAGVLPPSFGVETHIEVRKCEPSMPPSSTSTTGSLRSYTTASHLIFLRRARAMDTVRSKAWDTDSITQIGSALAIICTVRFVSRRVSRSH